jgi:aminoglycoside/choline kinase family phosphotransferase
MPAFVTDPALLTSESLSRILGRRVTGVTVSEVTGGLIARTVRLRLDYGESAPDAPRSLVAKVPAVEELPRMLAKAAGLYTREVLFYRKLAPTLDMRVPHCYFGEIDDDGERFLLLLEDIADSTVHDQDEEWPADDVLLAIRQLALLHSSRWNDPDLTSAGWLNRLDGEQLPAWEGLFRAAWKDFTGRDEVVLDPDLLALGERFAAAGFDTWVGGYRGPLSLAHADFHVSNLLYRTGADGRREIVTVDWQMAMHAPPLIDVAYFLGRMPIASRRACERDLVAAYHDALAVDGYSWERCWEDYERWSWYGVVSALIAVVGTPLSPEEAHLYSYKVTRYLTQVADHDSARFLR